MKVQRSCRKPERSLWKLVWMLFSYMVCKTRHWKHNMS